MGYVAAASNLSVRMPREPISGSMPRHERLRMSENASRDGLGQQRGQLLAGPMQTDADRVRAHPEHGRDDGNRQILEH